MNERLQEEYIDKDKQKDDLIDCLRQQVKYLTKSKRKGVSGSQFKLGYTEGYNTAFKDIRSGKRKI